MIDKIAIAESIVPFINFSKKSTMLTYRYKAMYVPRAAFYCNKIALGISFLIVSNHGLACRKKSPVKGSFSKYKLLFEINFIDYFLQSSGSCYTMFSCLSVRFLQPWFC